jgi:hypothetical protein
MAMILSGLLFCDLPADFLTGFERTTRVKGPRFAVDRRTLTRRRNA